MMQEWFRKAKLGIFIHWGIYSVDGIPESWSFGTGNMSYDDYMKQLKGFTASKYDPKHWAEVFKKAGAKYAVLTSKHHDGVALFDTKYTDLNVVKSTPAGRDLIAPYCDALREQGIKVGIYFTNTDWSDDDHLSVILNMSHDEIKNIRHEKFQYNQRWSEVCSFSDFEKEKEEKELAPTEEQKAAWKRFMARYKGEIEEIFTNYGQVDLLWTDVMIQRKGFSWESKEVKDLVNSKNAVANSRLGAYGDYETPECYIPLMPLGKPWELCTTFNGAWGYQPSHKRYKTVKQIVRMFVECISKGGNMLISCGPTPEGEIPPEQEKLMSEPGEWTSKYAEAIYPTKQGIHTEYFLGGTTLSEDNKTLYLFCYDKPNGKIMLNGIRSKIKKVTSMASGNELEHVTLGGAGWINMPGCIWINVDEKDTDDVCTVIKVELEDEIELVDLNDTAKSVGGI